MTSYSCSRSSGVKGHDAKRKAIYDFLSMNNCNYVSSVTDLKTLAFKI